MTNQVLPRIVVPNINKERTGQELAAEIRDGTLVMRADSLAGYNFAFVIGEQPVGVFSICSDGAGRLTTVRAWNAGAYSRDPFSGLDVPCAGRQFGKAIPSPDYTPVLFIIEYTQLWVPCRKVAFKARNVKVYDCDLPVRQADLRFEALDMRELEFLG